MYRFEDILALIEANTNIEIEKPVPSCPKHADINCANIAGNCKQGNNMLFNKGIIARPQPYTAS